MKKEAYYFSHDANAQDDPKCILLIDKHGMTGYGIFWSLIEKLRSQKDFKLPINAAASLAKRWRVSPKKVESVINDFELFITDEKNNFYSERLHRSMTEKSEKARQSSSYRWENANALRSHSTNVKRGMRNDANKGKESKEKERDSEPRDHSSVCYDVETLLTTNKIQFEKLCMAGSIGEAAGLIELHKCHVWLQKNEMYPLGVLAAYAQFESWLGRRNEFKPKEEKTHSSAPPLKYAKL